MSQDKPTLATIPVEEISSEQHKTNVQYLQKLRLTSGIQHTAVQSLLEDKVIPQILNNEPKRIILMREIYKLDCNKLSPEYIDGIADVLKKENLNLRIRKIEQEKQNKKDMREERRDEIKQHIKNQCVIL